MIEQGIFKGGTLIINLNSIEMIDKNYTFEAGDKVRIALKRYDSSKENVLYDELTTTTGETTIQKIFTHEETFEKFEVGDVYELQADLINATGVFPMLLQKLEVVGQAIVPDKE